MGDETTQGGFVSRKSSSLLDTGSDGDSEGENYITDITSPGGWRRQINLVIIDIWDEGYLRLSIILSFIVLSVVFYCLYEGWPVIDSVYFVIFSITTVGYGTPSPTDDASHGFTIVLMIFGVFVIFSTINGFIANSVEKLQGLVRKSLVSTMVRANSFFKRRFMVSLLWITSVVLIGATFCHLNEGWSFTTALYFAVQTITTVGYGELAIERDSTKAFLCVYMVLSAALVAYALNSLATLLQHRKMLLQREELLKLQTKLDFLAGLNGGRGVGKHQFVLTILEHLGTVRSRDIEPWMEKFRRLDTDHSGFLDKYQLEAFSRQEKESSKQQIVEIQRMGSTISLDYESVSSRFAAQAQSIPTQDQGQDGGLGQGQGQETPPLNGHESKAAAEEGGVLGGEGGESEYWAEDGEKERYQSAKFIKGDSEDTLKGARRGQEGSYWAAEDGVRKTAEDDSHRDLEAGGGAAGAGAIHGADADSVSSSAEANARVQVPVDGIIGQRRSARESRAITAAGAVRDSKSRTAADAGCCGGAGLPPSLGPPDAASSGPASPNTSPVVSPSARSRKQSASTAGTPAAPPAATPTVPAGSPTFRSPARLTPSGQEAAALPIASPSSDGHSTGVGSGRSGGINRSRAGTMLGGLTGLGTMAGQRLQTLRKMFDMEEVFRETSEDLLQHEAQSRAAMSRSHRARVGAGAGVGDNWHHRSPAATAAAQSHLYHPFRQPLPQQQYGQEPEQEQSSAEGGGVYATVSAEGPTGLTGVGRGLRGRRSTIGSMPADSCFGECYVGGFDGTGAGESVMSSSSGGPSYSPRSSTVGGSGGGSGSRQSVSRRSGGTESLSPFSASVSEMMSSQPSTGNNTIELEDAPSQQQQKPGRYDNQHGHRPSLPRHRSHSMVEGRSGRELRELVAQTHEAHHRAHSREQSVCLPSSTHSATGSSEGGGGGGSSTVAGGLDMEELIIPPPSSESGSGRPKDNGTYSFL